MDVCTIIARNYAPYARVLARSHAEHHPGSKCFVLVIDGAEGYIDQSAEPFELVTVPEIGVDHFERMAALYDVLELSTAVKPWLLKHLLDQRGIDRLAYLDPDIRIFAPLDEVDQQLRHSQLVVTPHATEPMPRDGRRPSEAEILAAGVYNLGFIGVARGEDTDFMLDWWAERLERDCLVDPARGFFVDQRWIDFAPGLVESFHILRDPGYNLAYWNLAGRDLRHQGARFTVNGRPLRFFHFSGFRADRPELLSRHQNRIQVTRGSALERICADYAAALLDDGYEEASRWPYGYAKLPNGLELDATIRAVYREATARGALDGSVFEPEGARELLDHLNGPAEAGASSGVTRYLHELLEQDAGLKARFGDLRGVDAANLVRWAETDGGAGIPQQLLPSEGSHLSAGGPPRPRAGVNLAGYFRSVLGIGEVARGLVDALEAQNVAVAPVGLRAGDYDEQDTSVREAGPSYATFPINLICVNADGVPAFVDRMGPDFFAGRHSIGLWWWEVSEFPERWLASFDHLDEVWAGSDHVAAALSAVSPVPVVKVTTPVEVAPFEALPRERLGLPEGFLFLFVFDHNSVFERKNPLAAIKAFERAFEPGEGACLVLKCIGHERNPRQHAELLAAAAEHPDVHVIDRALPAAEKDALIDACDCYVSLHRAEGFGITMAEAMAMGTPVIATAYSGNLDFMTAESSWLVDYDLVPIGEGSEPYPPHGEWAEPDLDHAARHMREVYEDPAAARVRALRGQSDIRRTHSREAAGASMARRLVRIQERWGLRGAGLTRDVRGAAGAATVARQISRGPEAPGRRLSAPRRVARDLLLRVLKPYSAFQRSVDEELLHAIRALDDRLQALAAGQAQLRPQVQRLVAESRALPEGAVATELAEHPIAGVVEAYAGEAAGDAEPRAGGRPGGRAIARLTAGCEPVLELTGRRDGELHDIADGSLGAMVARGVVEGLSADELPGFFSVACEKLRPDGLLVVETPNPHVPSVLKSFWADPSHVRPVFPEVAITLARRAGFESAFVFHPGGSGNAEADRFYEPVYALVAAQERGTLGLVGAEAATDAALGG